MSHLSVFGNFWEPFQHETAAFNGEQEKESINRVRVNQKNQSLGITVCHHLASLVMPKGYVMYLFCMQECMFYFFRI